MTFASRAPGPFSSVEIRLAMAASSVAHRAAGSPTVLGAERFVREVEVGGPALEPPPVAGPGDHVLVVAEEAEDGPAELVAGDVDPRALGRRTVAVEHDDRICDEMVRPGRIVRVDGECSFEQRLDLGRTRCDTQVAVPLAVIREESGVG